MRDVLLERDASGFTVRVETERSVHAMTDGGAHATLEEFLPRARSWLAEIGHAAFLPQLDSYATTKDLR